MKLKESALTTRQDSYLACCPKNVYSNVAYQIILYLTHVFIHSLNDSTNKVTNDKQFSDCRLRDFVVKIVGLFL